MNVIRMPLELTLWISGRKRYQHAGWIAHNKNLWVLGMPNVVRSCHFQIAERPTEIDEGPLRCRIVSSTVDGDPVRFNCDSNLRTDRPSPSWNFVVSQFFGTIEKVPDKELFPLLSRQIEQFEKKHGSDWRLRDATEYFKEQLLEAVFGIYFKCERVTTAFKRGLTSPADQVTITAWNHILNSRYDALNQWMNH